MKKQNTSTITAKKIDTISEPIPITEFQQKLEEELFDGITIRSYFKEIYDKVSSDRIRIKELYDKIFENYDKEGDQPEINFLTHISTYQKLIKECNDQLIDLAKIIEKIVNSNKNANMKSDSRFGKNEDEDDDDWWKRRIIQQNA